MHIPKIQNNKKAIILIIVCQVMYVTLYISTVHGDSEKTPITVQTQSEKGDSEAFTNNNADKKSDVIKTEGGSLFRTVKQGGPVMVPIILLGIISLTISIERCIYFTRTKSWTSQVMEQQLCEIAANSPSRFREDIEDDMRNTFQIYSNNLERGLTVLSGIGNLAPILGFLGTVTGMISAFSSIAAATAVNAKIVAAGIQEALITTAAGLIIAAPTLGFYYLFMHIIQSHFSRSEEIISSSTEKNPRLSIKLHKEEITHG